MIEGEGKGPGSPDIPFGERQGMPGFGGDRPGRSIDRPRSPGIDLGGTDSGPLLDADVPDIINHPQPREPLGVPEPDQVQPSAAGVDVTDVTATASTPRDADSPRDNTGSEQQGDEAADAGRRPGDDVTTRDRRADIDEGMTHAAREGEEVGAPAGIAPVNSDVALPDRPQEPLSPSSTPATDIEADGDSLQSASRGERPDRDTKLFPDDPTPAAEPANSQAAHAETGRDTPSDSDEPAAASQGGRKQDTDEGGAEIDTDELSGTDKDPVYSHAIERIVTEEIKYNSDGWGEYLENQLRTKVKAETDALYAAREPLEAHHAQLGLADVDTTADLSRKAAELSEHFDSLPPQEQFQLLVDMRDNNRTGLLLLGHTNSYLSEVLGRDRLPDSDRASEFRRFLDTRGAEGHDKPFTFDAVELPDKVDLPYRDIVLHDALYIAAVKGLADRTDRDRVTGEPLFYTDEDLAKLRLSGRNTLAKEKQALTAAEAARRSRPLPATLSAWEDAGLFDVTGGRKLDIIDANVVFQTRPDRIGNATRIFLPGGLVDGGVVARTQREIGDARGQVARGEFTEARERISRLQAESDSAMLRVQRTFYDAVVAGLQEADQPLHPDVEKKVKQSALHLVSGGEGRTRFSPWVQAHADEIGDDPGRDNLAAFTPWLQRYAYKNGAFQDPLIEEMQRRCEAQGLDPKDVAALIRDAASKRKEVGASYQPDPGDTEWFVRESLNVVSTVDNNGNYDPDPTRYESDPEKPTVISKVTPRSHAAIEDIVTRLLRDEVRAAA